MSSTKTEWVDLSVPAAEQKDVAIALLDAAGDNHRQVRSVTGGFCVPKTLAVAAGLLPADEEPAADDKGAAKSRGAKAAATDAGASA